MRVDAKLLQSRLEHVNTLYGTNCFLETKKDNLYGYRIMNRGNVPAFKLGWDVMTGKECLHFLAGLIAAYDFLVEHKQVLK